MINVLLIEFCLYTRIMLRGCKMINRGSLWTSVAMVTPINRIPNRCKGFESINVPDLKLVMGEGVTFKQLLFRLS